jgi:hypothetical protein
VELKFHIHRSWLRDVVDSEFTVEILRLADPFLDPSEPRKRR